jgi:hypothetical protein
MVRDPGISGSRDPDPGIKTLGRVPVYKHELACRAVHLHTYGNVPYVRYACTFILYGTPNSTHGKTSLSSLSKRIYMIFAECVVYLLFNNSLPKVLYSCSYNKFEIVKV